METSASIKFALESLHRIRCERVRKKKKPFPVEILIARNVDKNIVRKNKKKPELILDKFVRAASSSSLSSLASLTSQNNQNNKVKSQENNTNSKLNQLVYCLEDDSLRVTSAFGQKDYYDNKKVITHQKPFWLA